MWQDQSYSTSQPSFYGSPAPQTQGQPLQFYSPDPAASAGDFYAARPSMDSHARPSVASGSISSGGGVTGAAGYGGSIASQGGWLSAFGTGGFEGEPPLLEELGINFGHIRAKSMAVLNPFTRVDARIMDDADLAGPLLFCLSFAMFLLFSGKAQFNYIYGVGVLGSVSIYMLLNLMSDAGIDAYRVCSILGYCLLPMVGIGAVSVMFTLDGMVGYLLSSLSIAWCTWAASGIFVAVLRMSDQRLLVAYPVGLLYGCFALLSVFNVGTGATGSK